MTSVEQEIVFGMENLALSNQLMKRRVMEVSSALSVSEQLNDFIPELSGGQKQKVALASVLAMQPGILLLDEPTSQLDPVAGEEILTMVRRLNEDNGITVILVEQRLERCFHMADRILVMDQGRIIHDLHKQTSMNVLAVQKDIPCLPPLAQMFIQAGCAEIPATVKQGRDIVRSYMTAETAALDPGPAEKAPRRDKQFSQRREILSIRNLWFSYPNGREVLKDINLNIKAGEFIVLMGANGTGKTTLLKQINGLLKPDRGQVTVLGQDSRARSVEDLAADIGYLAQNPSDYLFLPTVQEELEFTLHNLGRSDDGITAHILERFHLSPCRAINPRDLSTGQRQRVALASVLISRPRLLLLDEPTRGLDYVLKGQLGAILQELQAEGTAILVVTHDVEFAAEFAEEIVLMDQGGIIARGDKYAMLSDSTFYSPQIGKLFNNIVDGVITMEQGRKALSRIMANYHNREVV
jgi:energy-coupling factor transport system ATP-binding protein